jgi:RHS repeat-associated protein
MNIHPNTTPASPSLASPPTDAAFDPTESLTTSFSASELPTLETTTVTEVTLGYHRNGQYSITAMTTSTGAVAERYAYTAYGQPTILNASGSVLTKSAVGNRYTYTGREWDETVGLHHFRAQWISPLAGRFLGRDPIGLEGSEWGLYEYAASSPLDMLDPFGLDCKSEFNACIRAAEADLRQCLRLRRRACDAYFAFDVSYCAAAYSACKAAKKAKKLPGVLRRIRIPKLPKIPSIPGPTFFDIEG